MKSARQLSFEILNKIFRNNAYSNIEIDSRLNGCELDQKNKAFSTAIVYGVLERKLTLDYVMSLYLKQPLKKLKPEVLTALRMGTYQILFMDKVPVSAAINESVNLVKKNGCAFASGLANAVLRKISKNGLVYPEINNNKIKHYSIKYSCPENLINLWIKSYGEENAIGIIKESLGAVPIVIRVNTLKIKTSELLQMLINEGINAKVSEEIEDALILEKVGSVESLDSYKKGLFHVQDIASQLCCKVLGAKEDEIIFDLCAAPGGKSFTIAEYMNNKGKLLAFDLYPQRVDIIKSGAKRLGISNLESKISDASVLNEDIGQADRVLCDVPCSGLGIIRRKPEIRYKLIENIDNLVDIQYHILRNASTYVKIGGALVYSTCSLNPQENEEVCKRFLDENKEFKSVSINFELETYNNNSKFITLMPHINNSDGFFIAKFVRTESNLG